MEQTLEQAGRTGANSLGSLSTILTGAKNSLVSFLKTPAGAGAAGLATAYGMFKAIDSLGTRGGFLNELFGIDDNLIHDLDHLNESASDASQIANTSKADLATLENAQAATQSRINELMSTKNLSADQQTELKGLQSQNAELQHGIALKKKMVETQSKEATQRSLDVFNDASVSDFTKKTGYSKLDDFGDKNSLTEGAKNEINFIKEKEQRVAELEKDKAKAKSKSAKEDIKSQISEINKEIDGAYASLNEKMETINLNAPNLYNDDGSAKKGAEDIVKDVEEIKSSYNHLVLDPEDAAQLDIEQFFTGPGMDSMRARLIELGQEGKVGIEALKDEFPGLIAGLEAAGIKTDDVIKYFNALDQPAGNASEQLKLMADPLDSYEAALQTENAGDDQLKIMEGLEKTKQLADQGLIGTDDFKTFAKMISPEGKTDKKSFYKNYEKLKNFDTESEGGRENLLKKLQGANPGYATFDKKSKTWKVNIENTAKAAKDLGIAVAPLEAMLGRLQDYGTNVNFTSMIEQFNEAQTSLSGLKELSANMEDGAEKDQLLEDINGYEGMLKDAEGDLSNLSPEIVAEIKFRYSQEQLKQEMQQAQDNLEFASNEASPENIALYSNAAQKQNAYLEGNRKALGYDKDSSKMSSEMRTEEAKIAVAKEQLNNSTDPQTTLDALKKLTDAQTRLAKLQEQELKENKKNSNNPNKEDSKKNNQKTSDNSSNKENSDNKNKGSQNSSSFDQPSSHKYPNMVGPNNPEQGRRTTPSFEYPNKVMPNNPEQGRRTTPSFEYPNKVMPNNPEQGRRTTPSFEYPNKVMPNNPEQGKTNSATLTYKDEATETVEKVNETPLEDKTASLHSDDLASRVVDVYNALGLGDKTSALSALDLASSILGNYNSKNIKDKNSTIAALDQATVILATIIGLLNLIPRKKKTTIETTAVQTGGVYRGAATADPKNSKPNASTPKKGKGKNGPSTVNGTAHAQGDWSAPATERALVGELGQETIVRDGHFFTVGDNGAEFANIRRGDIIFNHEQTKELFKKGYVTSGGGRGRSYAKGTAYAGSKKSKLEKALDSLNKLFDWTEIRLNRLSENTQRFTTKAQYATDLKGQQSAYQSAISSTGKEISGQQSAYKKYMKEARHVAKKTGLSSSIQKKVRNGTINISSYDENTQRAIQEYQKWYDKAIKCKDAVTDLRLEQRKLAKEKLDNIVSHYDSLNKVLSSIGDKYSSYRNYRSSMGYSQTSDAEKSTYINERKQKSGELGNLTAARKKYVAEFNKQKFKRDSDEWREGKAQIAAFDAAIYDAKTTINELNAQIRDCDFKKFELAIDAWSRKIKAMENKLSLKEKKGEKVTEGDYANVIKANNKEYDYQEQLKKKYQARQAYVAVNSKEYQELADKISACDDAMTSLKMRNEEYKQSIRTLRWKPFNEGIDNLNRSNDELRSIQSFINQDNLMDDKGKLTSEGFANLALIGQQMGNHKQIIADYTAGLKKLDKELKNGNITQDEYNEQQKEFLDNIRNSASSIDDLKNNIIDLAKAQLQAENEALTKSISKRSEALRKKKEYYDYDKTIRTKNKDINALKAQIAALEGVSNKAGQAERERLKAELAEREDDLSETRKEHSYNLRIEGYDKLSGDANEALDKTLKALETNSELQKKTVSDMLGNIKDQYRTAYNEIAKIIEQTGIITSENTKKNLEGLKNPKSANEQVNKANTPTKDIKPSGGATTVNTTKIDTETKAPSDKKERPVAQVKLSKSKLTLTVGASTTLKATILPSDSGQKKVTWSSTAGNIATVDQKGKVKAVKAGTAKIRATAGGKVGECVVTVKAKTKKKPAKPSKPTNPKGSGGNKKSGGNNKSGGGKKSSTAGMVSGIKDYIRSNSKAGPIKKVQQALNALGYKGKNKKKLSVDGIWGANTDYAVRTFQAKMGLVSDGIIGPKTKEKFKAKGYAFGTLGVSENQIARINELGKELVVRHNGSDYTYLSKGDSVIPADLTRNLMLWGRITPGALPLPSATVNTIAPDIDLNFDKFIEVKGNLDSSTMPDLRKAQKEITQLVTAELTREFRKLGHK